MDKEYALSIARCIDYALTLIIQLFKIKVNYFKNL